MARTCDHPLNGRVLYQLSYRSMAPAFPGSHLFLRSDRVAYSDQPIGCRKHELPYSCAPFRNEHDNGLEPIMSVWKTDVLPITLIVHVRRERELNPHYLADQSPRSCAAPLSVITFTFIAASLYFTDYSVTYDPIPSM